MHQTVSDNYEQSVVRGKDGGVQMGPSPSLARC